MWEIHRFADITCVKWHKEKGCRNESAVPSFFNVLFCKLLAHRTFCGLSCAEMPRWYWPHHSRATGCDDCAEGVVNVFEIHLPLLRHQTTPLRHHIDLLMNRVRMSVSWGVAPPSHLPIVKSLNPIADRSRSFQ